MFVKLNSLTDILLLAALHACNPHVRGVSLHLAYYHLIKGVVEISTLLFVEVNFCILVAYSCHRLQRTVRGDAKYRDEAIFLVRLY